jgi:hypothetical protein
VSFIALKGISQAATKLRLEDLDIKPYVITKLKMVGIESVFDLAISIPHQLVDIDGGMLTGTDEHVVLELVTKAKKALIESGLLSRLSLQTKSKVNQTISLQEGMVYVLQVGTLWVMLLPTEFS